MPDVAPNDAQSLLSVRNVSCAYTSWSYGLFGAKETKPVLKGVNLEIAVGEIFGLTGESGCGKSTLARCILGLMDYSGEIFLGGEKREPASGKSSPRAFARKAQMIFQDPGASLNPAHKIGFLMEEPLLIHRIGTAAERAHKIDAMLLQVGLDPSYKKRLPNELSGGQKQRVCIGRALLLEPKLLIADEAISALDLSVGAQILNLFRDLHRSLGLSVLFISHNADAVENLCNRIAVMRDGRIEKIYNELLS